MLGESPNTAVHIFYLIFDIQYLVKISYFNSIIPMYLEKNVFQRKSQTNRL